MTESWIKKKIVLQAKKAWIRLSPSQKYMDWFNIVLLYLYFSIFQLFKIKYIKLFSSGNLNIEANVHNAILDLIKNYKMLFWKIMMHFNII